MSPGPMSCRCQSCRMIPPLSRGGPPWSRQVNVNHDSSRIIAPGLRTASAVVRARTRGRCGTLTPAARAHGLPPIPSLGAAPRSYPDKSTWSIPISTRSRSSATTCPGSAGSPPSRRTCSTRSPPKPRGRVLRRPGQRPPGGVRLPAGGPVRDRRAGPGRLPPGGRLPELREHRHRLPPARVRDLRRPGRQPHPRPGPGPADAGRHDLSHRPARARRRSAAGPGANWPTCPPVSSS